MRGERYYRRVTAAVLRWYFELAEGVLPGAQHFDHGALDYHMDVERILNAELSGVERQMLTAVHRDGIAATDAARHAGAAGDRPDRTIALLEARLGRVFARRQMLQIAPYLDVPLRT